jgi:multisubunit Na+/H+ antiporter MnhF subunit
MSSAASFPPRPDLDGSAGADAPRRGNGIAAIGFLCGLTGMLSVWIVGVGTVLSALGIVFGIIGWRRSRRGASNGPMAVAGMLLGVVGFVPSVIFLSFMLRGGP